MVDFLAPCAFLFILIDRIFLGFGCFMKRNNSTLHVKALSRFFYLPWGWFLFRMKRGMLYKCCRDEGYNKLVLAQHLDDLAESFIMSALHNGQVRTMKANYTIEAGDVRVIRPLAYTRESITKEFARSSRLPLVNENCPACFEEPKERQRVKKMLAKEESLFPSMYNNIRRALKPLMDEDVYIALKDSSAEVTSRQMTKNKPSPEGCSKKSLKSNGQVLNVGSGEEHCEVAKTTEDVDGRKVGEGGKVKDIRQGGCENGVCVPCYELA
ncbi:unnamed protein product [Choristocarpus tenellus]